jgi:hypothetical protein
MCRIPAPNAVKVDLSARPTRPLVAHLPKVVLAAKGQYSLRGQEPVGKVATQTDGNKEKDI